MRVLLVEDDDGVAEPLAVALRRQGHQVQRAATLAEALTAGPADLVLLDLGLPDGDGIDLCRRLRRRGDQAGIIAVTARAECREKILGLRAGADDYLTKPYSLAELYARMEAVLRRVRPTVPVVVEVGPLRIDPGRHEVTRDGVLLSLTRREFELLAALARAPGQVVPRERLFAELWSATWRGVGHNLDVQVATLRAKLGEPRMIETVRGVGYRLAAGGR